MNFDKEFKSDKKLCVFSVGWGGGGGGGGAGVETKTVKTVNLIVKCGKIQKCNYLHNVEHVVRSTFRNMLITFKHIPFNSNFELSSQ